METQKAAVKQRINDLQKLNKLEYLLLENADEALYFYSTEGKLIYVNPAFQKITGYTTQELYEKNFIPFTHPDDQEWTMQLWGGLYRGEFFEDIEYRIIKKDGEVRWCLSTWKVVLDRDGQQVGIQGKQQDITRRKKLEKELLETQKSIVRSEFLSQVSHELRTPMNAIIGFGQLLKYGTPKPSEKQESIVDSVLDAGRHMVFLIDELLDLSQIEAGQYKALSELVSVNKIIGDCISLMQPQIQERQIVLINNIGSKEYYIQADFKRLKQVILNILSNAVKYNHMHGKIIIASHIVDKKSLQISVTNTGKGLTDSEIERLFTPFERINIPKNIKGTGLGLVISKHLVELMGGTIGVTSDGETGNTFWVKFVIA